jgi:glutathione S-transferase
LKFEMPKLLGTYNSPFVRKVRMALIEKRVPYVFIEAPPAAPGSIVPTVNPLGKVPALLTDDERSVYDSSVILEYLEVLHPEPALLPPPGMARVSVKRWEALADGICDAMSAVLTERRRENELQRSPEWIARQVGKIQRGVTTLADEIGGDEFCHGGRLTLADLAVMAALGFMEFRLPEINWRQEYPELGAYFSRHAQRKSFIDTMPFDQPPKS